jgi:hypothetical protein
MTGDKSDEYTPEVDRLFDEVLRTDPDIRKGMRQREAERLHEAACAAYTEHTQVCQACLTGIGDCDEGKNLRVNKLAAWNHMNKQFDGRLGPYIGSKEIPGHTVQPRACVDMRKAGQTIYEQIADEIQECQHEFEWVGGHGTPYGPTEPERVCKHCGAVDNDE